jgi:hypothetical protein
MPDQPARTNIHVRDVDTATWRELRAEAVRRGVPVGQLLSQAIREWLAQQPA